MGLKVRYQVVLQVKRVQVLQVIQWLGVNNPRILNIKDPERVRYGCEGVLIEGKLGCLWDLLISEVQFLQFSAIIEPIESGNHILLEIEPL